MEGGKSAVTVSEDSAEAQYVNAKTSVWWDIENCGTPRGCDPYSIAQNIISALSKINYCGPISISAYADTNQIPSDIQQALSSTGISLNHVPAGVKDASDKKILVDMLFWAVDNPAPAAYLLISGDRDFANCLHQLRMRRYNILLAQPNQASAALVSAAKTIWLWTSLVAGEGPIRKSEMAQPVNDGKQLNLEAMSKEPAKKCNQQGQIHQNSQHSGSKRPPSSLTSEKSSRARTELTQNYTVQCWNCAKLGHRSNGCKKPKRTCFLCAKEGHLRSFCSEGGPKSAQSQQDSTSSINNTPIVIALASQKATVMEQRTCYICKEQGHLKTSCPLKSGLEPSHSQPAPASYNNVPGNNPIGMPAQSRTVPALCKNLPYNNLGTPAQSQSAPASYNNLPLNNHKPASEQFTEQNK